MLQESPPLSFDFRNPDYAPIHRGRIEKLRRIRANPASIPALKNFYRDHIATFINDWGTTLDPRTQPVSKPFLLFPKQIEFVDWTVECWQLGVPGIVVKSRDCGASWLAMAISCSLALFHRNFAAGIIANKESLLDRSGDPDCLFFKARQFLMNLPAEFRGGFDVQKNSADQRLIIPETGSSVTGATGDNAGRGGRKSMVTVDEAAHIERPQLLDAALASVTNCRIDMSSVNGTGNSFAARARSGKIRRFDITWRDDPRKDEAWYQKKVLELDPITLNQEINCDFNASTEGQLIPALWINAAVDAHIKLGIEITGDKCAALDVADQGVDRNAFCGRHGILLNRICSWSGKNSDIFATAVKAFDLCIEGGHESFFFDADGLGAGILGDARVINEQRAATGRPYIVATAFRGSASVHSPRSQMVPGRYNEDFFANLKAQSWWSLRRRFEATYRALQGNPYDKDDLISIGSESGPELSALILELSQPTYSLNGVGRVLVDKSPEGSRSPNLADAAMIAFSPVTRTLEMWKKLAS
jgi:phage terminase large subunit